MRCMIHMVDGVWYAFVGTSTLPVATIERQPQCLVMNWLPKNRINYEDVPSTNLVPIVVERLRSRLLAGVGVTTIDLEIDE